MVDYTQECLEDLSRKKQEQATEAELRELFCASCRNLNCDRIETGPNDPMGKRARLQELRLLHPTIVDPTTPKYAPLARQDFADAREAAEAWSPRRPVPDLAVAPVSPDLLAQRGAGPRKILRDLPAKTNADEPRQVAPAVVQDPWDPSRGGMVVGSGATITLGGPEGDPSR